VHQNWDGEPSRQVKRGKNLYANVKVGRPLFHRGEVSEVVLITKVQRGNSLTCTDKFLVMAYVCIPAIVMLNNILKLREIGAKKSYCQGRSIGIGV
jgi:hypothetical protein